jgi:hypothetical protein
MVSIQYVCMYVYIRMYVTMQGIYMCVQVGYIHICMYVRMYVLCRVYIYILLYYVHTYVRKFMYMLVCVCICMCEWVIHDVCPKSRIHNFSSNPGTISKFRAPERQQWSKFHTDKPQVLGATAQSLLVRRPRSQDLFTPVLTYSPSLQISRLCSARAAFGSVHDPQRSEWTYCIDPLTYTLKNEAKLFSDISYYTIQSKCGFS